MFIPQKKVYEKSHDFKQRNNINHQLKMFNLYKVTISQVNFGHEKKNLITVQYTGWLIGISAMGYNKP